MKIAVIGAMAGITLCARDVKPKDQNTVTVYIEYEAASSRGLYAAMKMAAKMFAAAGVRIMWHFGEPSYRELDQDRPIVIRTSFGAPASERPGSPGVRASLPRVSDCGLLRSDKGLTSRSTNCGFGACAGS